jgi:ABC-type nitrate/sulfonate/bicarbonate transport system ATPase subunit
VDTPRLSIQGISKRFVGRAGTEVEALAPVSLSICQGEFVSIIGPSGCGKSTLLNLVAGLATPTTGRMLLDGEPFEGPCADRGVVFQKYTLYPWLDVQDNISFGLKLAGVSAAARRETAHHFMGEMGLLEFARAYPAQLSGGMQQRVAIARALAVSPKVLLMDEPFGALDAQTRESMQELLLRVRSAEEMTVLFITHDIDEALYLSDRVHLMSARPGQIVAQFDPPGARHERDQARTSPEFLAMRREIRALLRHNATQVEEMVVSIGSAARQ